MTKKTVKKPVKKPTLTEMKAEVFNIQDKQGKLQAEYQACELAKNELVAQIRKLEKK